MDFKIYGGDISQSGGFITKGLDLLEKVPGLNSDPNF